MKSAVIVFPGSNCDRDVFTVMASAGLNPSYVWHDEATLPEGLDLVVLPGGFSYGDYLRCGAMAARSPIMQDVIQFSFVFSAMNMGLSITSVVVATQLGVPFACVLAAVLFKDYLGPWRAGGLMVAFLGVLIVAGTPNASEHWGGICAGGARFVWLECSERASEAVTLPLKLSHKD